MYVFLFGRSILEDCFKDHLLLLTVYGSHILILSLTKSSVDESYFLHEDMLCTFKILNWKDIHIK